MGRLPENYLGPKHRITMLKGDYPKEKSAVLTDLTHTVIGDVLCVSVKASILIGDKVVATGHAFTDCPDEDKAVEKAETIAIGRALVNAGYPETSDDLETEEEPVKKSGGLGRSSALGSKSTSKEEKADVSETKKSSSEVVEQTTDTKSRGNGLSGLGRKSAGTGVEGASNERPGILATRAKSVDPADTIDESLDSESEDESEEVDSEDLEESSTGQSQEASASEVSSEEPKKKMTHQELLAKYRNKK